MRNLKSNIYTIISTISILKTSLLKKLLLKRSVFTLGVIIELFLSRSDETLYLEGRLLNGWSQL